MNELHIDDNLNIPLNLVNPNVANARLYKIEYLVLELHFLPYLNPDLPRITMSQRRQMPSGSVLTVRDWFQRVMAKELVHLPQNTVLNFTEWNIMSGNETLFNISGNLYDRLVVVFGEEKIHWIYYRNTPIHQRLEGCETLCVSFCSCCLQNQYKRVIATIINFMKKNYTREILAGTPRP